MGEIKRAWFVFVGACLVLRPCSVHETNIAIIDTTGGSRAHYKCTDNVCLWQHTHTQDCLSVHSQLMLLLKGERGRERERERSVVQIMLFIVCVCVYNVYVSV